MLSDQAFLRYNRQIRLPEVGEAGQQQLADAHVLLVGAGGLASPAALYLAAAGVGHLVIADDDSVDSSNLQRQVLFREDDQQQSKVKAAAAHLALLNSDVRVRAVEARLDGQRLSMEVSLADIVLDCSDNFATRHAVNAACFAHRKVLISAAAIRWQGQLMPYDFRQATGPCYCCLFPEQTEQSAQSCSESGIAGPVVGTMGMMQALETLKVITGAGQPAFGALMQFDGLTMDWQRFNLPANPHCPVCGEERS